MSVAIPLKQMHGADAEYARRVVAAGPGNLETFTLQARTRSTRDALALAASHGALDFRALMARVLYEAGHPAISQKAPTRAFDERAFLSLARIMANQATSPEETYEAVQLFKSALRNFGAKALKRTDRLIFAESLASLGYVKDLVKYGRQLKVDALDRNQVELLAANALAAGSLATHAKKPSQVWLDHVNAGYRNSGIETISFAPGDGPLFDRILCGPAEQIDGGPRVTVIVPTFNSGPRISTALRSLINQTWRNIEIIVMDDASPAENDRFLREWEGRDSRIRVHKFDENGGTYRARNFAVTHLATGDFITVHDDDDWSHPRKIETQVRQLLDSPNLVANMSLLSRATPDLIFTRINNNPVFTQPNYSSLMFRREPVLDQVGHWDMVNRSADAEFHDRLKIEFAEGTSVAGADVLSFLRVRSDSLTSGEIARGYIDSRRLWYQQSSRDWHTRSKEQGKSLFMAAFPDQERPFSAPEDMVGSRAAKSGIDVDILYVTDFRFPGGNSSVAAAEIRLLVEQGHRVALMQMASPVNSARATVQTAFLELSRSPLVSVVSREDSIEARLTLVRHPSVLQYADLSRAEIQTDHLVVIVNHAPYTRDGLGSIYELRQVADAAKRIFGRAAKFAPESDVIRANMKGALAPSSTLPFSWPGIVAGEAGAADVPPRRVVGRHSRDHPNKWPETPAKVLASYPDSRDYEVQILGGAETPRRLLDRLPDNWVVHPFGALDPMEFLRGIPFWVYQHHSSLTESFGMAAAEAMAAGCVVILPPYMRASFGEGAVYAEPDEVVGLIEGFMDDHDRYYEQRSRAMLYAQKNFSPAAFHARISSLLASIEES